MRALCVFSASCAFEPQARLRKNCIGKWIDAKTVHLALAVESPGTSRAVSRRRRPLQTCIKRIEQTTSQSSELC